MGEVRAGRWEGVGLRTSLGFELRANTFHRRQTASALGTLLLGIGLGQG